MTMFSRASLKVTDVGVLSQGFLSLLYKFFEVSCVIIKLPFWVSYIRTKGIVRNNFLPNWKASKLAHLFIIVKFLTGNLATLSNQVCFSTQCQPWYINRQLTYEYLKTIWIANLGCAEIASIGLIHKSLGQKKMPKLLWKSDSQMCRCFKNYLTLGGRKNIKKMRNKFSQMLNDLGEKFGPLFSRGSKDINRTAGTDFWVLQFSLFRALKSEFKSRQSILYVCALFVNFRRSGHIFSMLWKIIKSSAGKKAKNGAKTLGQSYLREGQFP